MQRSGHNFLFAKADFLLASKVKGNLWWKR